MKYSVLLSAIALFGVGLVATTQFAKAKSALPAISSPEQISPASGSESPRRLTISVTVAEPEDLKVKQGDRVEANQLVADRGRERRRLESQQAQLKLTLQRLQTASISAPQPLAQVPPMAALPPAAYLEEQASIERAKVSVAQAELTVAQKHQELDYLRSLENLDPIVMEHEQAQLAELQQTHTAAVRDYQLAEGRLSKAQSDTAYRDYQSSLDVAERVERANQSASNYQQQWADYEQHLRDRDFQVAQTQLRLDEVDNAVSNLAVVRSPYAGRIRRIKWLGQDSSGQLSAEITLLIYTGAGPGATLPEQQP